MLKWKEIHPMAKYVCLPIILLGTVALAWYGCCKYPQDNIIEEIVEDIIEDETGIDVDLSPYSKESFGHDMR